MPFKAILKELVESTPGASGAILADWEGEPIAQHGLLDDYELQVIAAHKGIIMYQIRELHLKTTGVEVRDAVIKTDKSHVIIGVVAKDYSLVMTLAQDALPGRALHRFRFAVELLAKEI